MIHNHFTLELIKLGIDFMENAKVRLHKPGFYEDRPFRSLLIYNILEIKPGLWVPLNRDYNVLGSSRDKSGDSDYRSDIYKHLWVKSEDINFNILWDNGDGKSFFTFSDSTYPGIFYKQSYIKQYNRYKDVIETAFFKGNKITFDQAWTYKENPDPSGLAYNKNRIKSAVIEEVDDETFRECLNTSRKELFNLMRNLSNR